MNDTYYHTRQIDSGSDKAPAWFLGLMGIFSLCLIGPLAWILLSVSITILAGAI
jgi:hypothetical protein